MTSVFCFVIFVFMSICTLFLKLWRFVCPFCMVPSLFLEDLDACLRPVMYSLHYQLECTTNFLSIYIDCIFLLNFFWNDVFVKGLSITRIVVRYDTVV